MSLETILFDYISPAIGLLVICTNLTEIVMLISRKKKNQFNTPLVYVLGLSISDLMVGIVIVCYKTFYFLVNFKVLQSSEALCTFLHLMKYLFLRMSLIMSITSLLALTIDRMRATQVAIQRKQKTATYISALSGFFSIVLASTLFLSRKYKVLDEKELFIFPLLSLPSSVFFIIAYAKIIQSVRQRRITLNKCHLTSNKENNEMKALREDLIDQTRVGETDKLSLKDISSFTSMKKEYRLLKLSISVVLVFLLCWMPLSVCGILVVAGIHTNTVVLHISFLLAFSNSLINPILYFTHTRKLFKKFFSDVLLKLKQQCPFVSRTTYSRVRLK